MKFGRIGYRGATAEAATSGSNKMAFFNLMDALRASVKGGGEKASPAQRKAERTNHRASKKARRARHRKAGELSWRRV
jgi:hypothetical protein